jgi:hypothetical protein
VIPCPANRRTEVATTDLQDHAERIETLSTKVDALRRYL